MCAIHSFIFFNVDTPPQNFKDYLKSLYDSYTLTQPFFDSWPGPPAYVREYITLALIKKGLRNDESEFVQKSIAGKVEDLSQQNCSVKLENLFDINAEDGKRRVILLEGASGSGKSTLSIYIAQQVLQGKLFHTLDIWLPILIELRHEPIQKARCLLDLLPNNKSMITQQAKDYITGTYGRGVLFILDGWDELPDCYRNKDSIFGDIISPNSSQTYHLQESYVIVTSRPIAAVDLYGCVSQRVEILGFSSRGLQEYVSKCLGNVKNAKNLIKTIEANPSLAGILKLPFNASIVLYLHENSLLGDIQTATQYNILSKLILNIIDRNQRKKNKSEKLTSLDHLPKHLSDNFLELCKFAYQKIKDNEFEFSLPTGVCTLGLLNCVERFTPCGKEKFFHFAHLSIQELLAAHHIAYLNPKEQAVIFDRLHDKHTLRFTAVFRYYAAITGLKNHKVIEVISKAVAALIHAYTPTNESKTCLLSILHYLYEAQNQNVSKQVARHLQQGLNLQHKMLTSSDCLCIGYLISRIKTCLLSILHYLYEAQNQDVSKQVARHLQQGLYLRYKALTSSDCHCIGYFLSYICQMDTGRFQVDLDCCNIGDQGFEHLVIGLCENLRIHGSMVTTQLSITIRNNGIGHKGCVYLSSLLKHNCVINLNLSLNNVAFKLSDKFANELETNATLRSLYLDDCSLNSESVMMLTFPLSSNQHLETLSLCFNDLYLYTWQLFSAIQYNRVLKVLYLCNCSIADEGLVHIANSLEENTSITELMLYNMEYDAPPNEFTENRVSLLANNLAKNYTLSMLVLPKDLELFISRNQLQESINIKRKQSGYKCISIIGRYPHL